MFADGVIIFSKAHPSTMLLIKQILQELHMTTGLEASQANSQVFFGGCNDALRTSYLQATGFQEGTLPMQYLGIPITASRLSKLECRTFVDKIMVKVRLWSTKKSHLQGGHNS